MASGQTRLLAAPIALLALYGTVQGASLFKHDLQFTKAETEVSFWGRGNYQPTPKTVSRTARAVENLVQHAPHNPAYRSLQANSFAWRAYWEADATTSQQYAQQAVGAQAAAVQARPAYYQGQVKLAEYEARLQDVL